ncbi:MAG TPA: GNAT family N-acetyltransferase, partial [Humisphaera sp.]
KHHHYLSHDLHPRARCFVGLVGGEPAAFVAVLPFPHATAPGWREHRAVCLPDYQGVGLGNALSAFVAGVYAATGRPYYSRTTHPAMIRHRSRSPLWRMTERPSLKRPHAGGGTGMTATTAVARLSAGFAYVGPPRPAEAKGFGLV